MQANLYNRHIQADSRVPLHCLGHMEQQFRLRSIRLWHSVRPYLPTYSPRFDIQIRAIRRELSRS